MKPPKKNFMSLPVFDDCCKRVDTTCGMFIECVCGDIVKTRVGSAFKLGHWNENNNEPDHLDKIALFRNRAKSIENKLARGDKISNQDKKKQKTEHYDFFLNTHSIIIIGNITHIRIIIKRNTLISRIISSILNDSIYICIQTKYYMPRRPSKLQKIYNASTFDII